MTQQDEVPDPPAVDEAPVLEETEASEEGADPTPAEDAGNNVVQEDGVKKEEPVAEEEEATPTDEADEETPPEQQPAYSLEEPKGARKGDKEEPTPNVTKPRRWILPVALVLVVILLVIVIVVPVMVTRDNDGDNDQSATASSATETLIMDNSPVGTAVFDDPDSYQSKALAWSLYHPSQPTTDEDVSDERLLQRYALACIYYATYQVATPWTDVSFGGGLVLPWEEDEGWLTFEDECDWYGLECDEQGLVEEIDLEENLLTGTFPPEVTLMKASLKVLNLSGTYVMNVGDEGNAFLGELTALEELYYSETHFGYDGIPTFIGQLTSLTAYDCSYTLYYGELRPEVFADLTNLEWLSMGGLSFNGSLPTTLSKLPNLRFLYAEFSDVIGDLSFMLDMPEIYELWVDRNPLLTGTLFTEIGELVTLESFSTTRCGLTGTLPSELAQLVDLQQMWLSYNDLRGNVPSELGLLTALRTLELEGNTLMGTMPAQVCANRVMPSGGGGVLENLQADCATAATNGTIVCDCCSCCGLECVDA